MQYKMKNSPRRSPFYRDPKWLLLSVIGLTLINRDISQAQSPPPKPQINPELERLEYFEGTWNCQQPAASTEASGKFNWTVKQDLNQFWYIGNANQTIVADNVQPINSHDFMGYDSASKQLVRSVIVSNGNSYNLVAQDWQNDKLIWSGILVSKGEATPLREEIIKNSPDKFTATYFFPKDTGEWIQIVDESCSRSNPAPK